MADTIEYDHDATNTPDLPFVFIRRMAFCPDGGT